MRQIIRNLDELKDCPNATIFLSNISEIISLSMINRIRRVYEAFPDYGFSPNTIFSIFMKLNLVRSSGKTPQKTIASRISTDLCRKKRILDRYEDNVPGGGYVYQLHLSLPSSESVSRIDKVKQSEELLSRTEKKKRKRQTKNELIEIIDELSTPLHKSKEPTTYRRVKKKRKENYLGLVPLRLQGNGTSIRFSERNLKYVEFTDELIIKSQLSNECFYGRRLYMLSNWMDLDQITSFIDLKRAFKFKVLISLHPDKLVNIFDKELIVEEFIVAKKAFTPFENWSWFFEGVSDDVFKTRWETYKELDKELKTCTLLECVCKIKKVFEIII